MQPIVGAVLGWGRVVARCGTYARSAEQLIENLLFSLYRLKPSSGKPSSQRLLLRV